MTADTSWNEETGTLAQLLDRVPEHVRNRVLIGDGDSTLTFDAVDRRSRTLARQLHGLGVRAGDRVALWMGNRVEWVVAQFGVYRAGAVLVPLNPQNKAAEVAHVLRDAEVRLLVYEHLFLGTVDASSVLAEARRLAPDSLELGVLTPDDPLPGELAMGDDDDSCVDPSDGSQSGPDDVVQVMYTSGTTGLPKGVRLTSRGLLTTYRSVSRNLATPEPACWLLSLPMSTMFGCAAVLIPAVLTGSRIEMLPRFNPETSLAAIRGDGPRVAVTHLTGSPAMYTMLLEAGLAATEHRVVGGIIAGAVAAPELVHTLVEEVGIRDLVNMFGQTEGCGTLTMTVPRDPMEKRVSTVGRVLPHAELRIARVDGSGWGRPGEVGEICARGRAPGVHTFAGYEGDVAESPVDSDGWLHYGDLGSLDDDGYLSVGSGRLKEMYVSGGYNVYPPEVERILQSHPGVELVAVAGIPDERLGEIGMAWVVPVTGSGLTSAGLVQWCREQMSHYKAPARIRLVDVLPTTPSGKVRRGQLRQCYLDAEAGT